MRSVANIDRGKPSQRGKSFTRKILFLPMGSPVGPTGVEPWVREFEEQAEGGGGGGDGELESEAEEQKVHRRDGDDLREEFGGDERSVGGPGVEISERGVLTHSHCLAPPHPSVRPASMPQPPWMSCPPL